MKLNNCLNTYFFVPKGLNINNPVRSAGENIPITTAAPEGLNMIRLKFNPFGAVIALIIYRAFHTRLFKFNPFGALGIKADIHKIIKTGKPFINAVLSPPLLEGAGGGFQY